MSTSKRSRGLYIARRTLQAIPLVLGVLVLAFVLIHLAPPAYEPYEL